MYEPIATQLALKAARAVAGSALPDAPVVPDRAPRRSPIAGARVRLATDLRAVAHWIEPRTRPTNACQNG